MTLLADPCFHTSSGLFTTFLGTLVPCLPPQPARDQAGGGQAEGFCVGNFGGSGSSCECCLELQRVCHVHLYSSPNTQLPPFLTSFDTYF